MKLKGNVEARCDTERSHSMLAIHRVLRKILKRGCIVLS